MHPAPTVPAFPAVDDALLSDGHVWLLEAVRGESIRFQLLPSGVLRFGTEDETATDLSAFPARFRATIRDVRTTIDREELRNALETVTDVTFVGVATCYRGIAYDWDRLPPFLGTEIWSERTGNFLPPDVCDTIYRRLGLTALPVIDREVRIRDFDPESYRFPGSSWYDGPVSGVFIRNKRGNRGLLRNDAIVSTADIEPFTELTASTLSELAVTDRFARLTDQGVTTVDDLTDRVIEACYREAHHRLEPIEATEFRSTVARQAAVYLA